MNFANSVLIGLIVLGASSASAVPTLLEDADQKKVMSLIWSVQSGAEAQYCSNMEDMALSRMQSQLNIEAQKLNSQDRCYTYTAKEVVTIGNRSERCISISRKSEIKRVSGSSQYATCN